jgi:hypothetical protein
MHLTVICAEASTTFRMPLKQRSGYCVQGIGETLALLDAGSRYDASVSPELDENGWKYVNAYGDCNSCSVQSDVNGSYMAEHTYGHLLFFSSLFRVLLLWAWHQKRGKQREVGEGRHGTNHQSSGAGNQPLCLISTDWHLLAVDYKKSSRK